MDSLVDGEEKRVVWQYKTTTIIAQTEAAELSEALIYMMAAPKACYEERQ